MSTAMRRRGFTMIELLVVILILAILMAVALPLYLRAVRDSQRQTCRSNMQTIANACQAYKVRSASHAYPTAVSDLVGTSNDYDLQAAPRCPTDSGTDTTDDYTIATNTDGTITIMCAGDGDSGNDATFHNALGTTTADGNQGFTPGVDSQ